MGERKNPRGRRKKRKKARAGRLDAGLKHHLGAIDLGIVLDTNNHGAKLDAKIYGAKVPVVTLLVLRDCLAPRIRPKRSYRNDFFWILKFKILELMFKMPFVVNYLEQSNYIVFNYFVSIGYCEA